MQPVQLKMARAALDLSIDQLAEKAGLSHADIARAEAGDVAEAAGTERLREVLEEAGIEWIDDDGVRYTGSGGATSIPIEDVTTGNDDGVS